METEEVNARLKLLGITLDHSPKDRERFQALVELMAAYAKWLGMLREEAFYLEDAEEWLIG